MSAGAAITGRLKRPIVLTALVTLAMGFASIAAFRDDHALLINASPSLPNWAFWLDKNAPIKRGTLLFFEPPPSELVAKHFGRHPQLFGKRVLGVPGDRVSHQGPDVFINGRKVATRLLATRLGIVLSKGPAGTIPPGCYYAGSAHPRGLDSRYGAIGFVCERQIFGSGRAIL